MVRTIRVGLAAVALATLITGCGGDEPRTTGRPPTATTTTTTSESTTSASSSTPDTPSTSEPAQPGAEVERQLQQLAERYDAVIAAVVADPPAADDALTPAVRDYLALFVEDSTFAPGVREAWADLASQGHSYRPGPRGQLYDSTITWVDPAPDGQTATFRLCSYKSIEVVDAAGNVISGDSGWNAAIGGAELQDGTWLFIDLTQDVPTGCDDEVDP